MPKSPSTPAPASKCKPQPSWRERATRRRDVNEARVQKMLPDEPPEDVDLMRNMLARKIAMYLGNIKASWRGCPEPCCRRARACIAPRIRCRMARPLPPDPDGRRRARTQALISRALAKFAAADGED